MGRREPAESVSKPVAVLRSEKKQHAHYAATDGWHGARGADEGGPIWAHPGVHCALTKGNCLTEWGQLQRTKIAEDPGFCQRTATEPPSQDAGT